LYRLILTIDANFRLKNKDRKNVKADDALGDGWGHWVPGVPYQQYIDLHGHKVEVRNMYVGPPTDPDPYHSRISVTLSYMRLTMQIRSFPMDTMPPVFVEWYVLVIHWSERMVWETCRRVNGKQIYC
jgi:hypothetical protein